jgi:multiple sugar transport system substrate-binding protein
MMRITTHLRALLLLALISALIVPTVTHAADAVTIRYSLWDTNQLPSYQQCADAFTKANPDITIKIERQEFRLAL